MWEADEKRRQGPEVASTLDRGCWNVIAGRLGGRRDEEMSLSLI